MTHAGRTMDVMGAYHHGNSPPTTRTRFTRTLVGPGQTRPRGGATVAMRALDARNVDAFDALDDVIYAAGDHMPMPWAAAYQDRGAAADEGALPTNR